MAAVGAPSPRRTVPAPSEMLPADTRRTLSGIVRQLRDVPRTIIGDPAEVVHFLGRTARALEQLRDRPVPVAMSQNPAPAETANAATIISAPTIVAPKINTAAAPPSAPRALSPRERAEAMFRPPDAPPTSTSAPPSPSSSPGPIGLSAPRTITDRKGRGVRVEVRRARAAGQLEMPV